MFRTSKFGRVGLDRNLNRPYLTWSSILNFAQFGLQSKTIRFDIWSMDKNRIKITIKEKKSISILFNWTEFFPIWSSSKIIDNFNFWSGSILWFDFKPIHTPRLGKECFFIEVTNRSVGLGSRQVIYKSGHFGLGLKDACAWLIVFGFGLTQQIENVFFACVFNFIFIQYYILKWHKLLEYILFKLL